MMKKQPEEGSSVDDSVNCLPLSPSVTSIVTGDPSLFMAASGVCTVVFSGLVSVALVALDDKLLSVTELRLFSPTMITGSVLFTVGALNGMLKYLSRKAKATPGEIFLPPGHPPVYLEKRSKTNEVDEERNSKKRVSRCPLGF